jgi:hypothetical protein
MRLSRLVFVLAVAVIFSEFVVPAASASSTGNDPCRVLTGQNSARSWVLRRPSITRHPPRRLVFIKARHIRADNS